MSNLPEQKRYEGVRLNVFSVTRGWVGVNFPDKKRYVTLEWPPIWQASKCKLLLQLIHIHIVKKS